jgi:hypothetical protein
MYEMITEEDFQNFLTLKYTEIDKEEDIDNMYKQLSEKYKHFSNRFQLLNFPSREEAEKYKIFLMDEYSLKNYYEFMNLVRTDEYIIKKNNEKIKNTFKIKSLSKSFNKISLISEFEKHYKISRFDLDFSKVDDKIVINENFQKLCKNIFRTEKDDFKTKEGLKKIYILMIKNMCGDLPIILSKQKGKKKIREYTINTIFFTELITIMKYKNPQLLNFNTELIKQISGISPEKECMDEELYEDENQFFNNYLFNKTNFRKN